MSQFEQLIPVFKEALCPTEFGFSEDGYLSPCFTNTYIFAPIALILALWAAVETKNVNTNGHPANTVTGSIKFILTAVYSVIIVLHGQYMFNVISLTSSMASLLIVFVLSFMDLKGVNVPQKPLEVYFFLVAAVSGYLTVHAIGTHRYDHSLLSSVYICLISSLAGSARNIISAFEDAQSEAIKKPKSQ